MDYLLMIPGPVPVSRDIKEAFNGPVVAHYGEEWRDLYISTAEKLSSVLGTSGMSFLIPGSGSLGLEIAASTYCRGRKVIIPHNGFFADRLYEIVSKYTDTVEMLRFGIGNPIDLESLESKIRNGGFDTVFMNHCETSTGMLNPIREIATMASPLGVQVYVDAISSAGAEEIDMDRWGLGVVVSASQKGFECPAGLALVACNSEHTRIIKEGNPVSWYTDLRLWYEYYEKWNDWHPFPVTLPTNTILALAKSLENIEAEGVGNRYERYKTISRKFRYAVRALGLKLYTDDDKSSHGITSVTTEGSFEPGELVLYLKKKMGIQIAGSLGELKPMVFRIGHLSKIQLETKNLSSVLVGIASFLREKNMPVQTEEAVKELCS